MNLSEKFFLKKIKSLFQLAEKLETNSVVKFDTTNTDLAKSLKYFLLDLKVQIDRWGMVSDIIIFSIYLKDLVLNFLKNELTLVNQINPNQDVTPSIWGANILFSDIIDFDTVLMANLDYEDDEFPDRAIAIGKIDIDYLKRLNALKAFW